MYQSPGEGGSHPYFFQEGKDAQRGGEIHSRSHSLKIWVPVVCAVGTCRIEQPHRDPSAGGHPPQPRTGFPHRGLPPEPPQCPQNLSLSRQPHSFLHALPPFFFAVKLVIFCSKLSPQVPLRLQIIKPSWLELFVVVVNK